MSDTIVRLAARGDGVTAGGRFVAFTAPGDRVDPAGAVEPGPHHAAPPCRHFPRCGGCQLQHVDDAAYRDFLVDRVRDALGSQRLEAEIRPPHLSPPRTRRRATLRAERIGRRVVLGFHEEKSHRIVDMIECHVLAPDLFVLVAPLRVLLGTLLTPRRSAGVSLTLSDQGVDVLLHGVEAEGLAASEALTDFAAQHRLARLSLDEGFGPSPRWEPAPVTVTLGDITAPLPSGAFLQATADGEAALRAGIEEAVAEASRVADLFAGLGTFALPLARGAKVRAVEGARDALLALKAASDRAMLGIAAEHRDLFRRPLTPAELGAFDAVVLDPPRAGAKEQVAELARADTGRIGYASCNPATFARDARTLVDGGWQLGWVRPIGQFRWSTHVELVAGFTR